MKAEDFAKGKRSVRQYATFVEKVKSWLRDELDPREPFAMFLESIREVARNSGRSHPITSCSTCFEKYKELCA